MKSEITLVNFEKKIPISSSIVRFDAIFRHMHPIAQLLLVLEGECDIYIGNKSYHASNNDMVVINPRQFHHILSKDGATIISVLIDVKGFTMEDDGDGIFFNLNTMEVKNNPRYNTIRYLVYSIIAYNTMENVNSIYTNRAIAYSFFAQLVNDFKMTSEDKNALMGESLDAINRINTYVNEHYKDKITLSFLSKKFNYSVSYLSRLYTSSFGESFINVYDNLRVNYSLNDLLQGNKTIQEISDEHGFEEVRSYIRAFKKIHGMTPNEYRNKHQKSTSENALIDNKLFRKQALDKILSRYEQYGSPNAHKKSETRDTEILLPLDLKAKRTALAPCHSIIEVSAAADLESEEVLLALEQVSRDMGFEYVMIRHLLCHKSLLLQQNENNQWVVNYVHLDRIVRKILSFHALPYLIFEYNENLLSSSDFYALSTQIIDYLNLKYGPLLDDTMVSFSFYRDKQTYTNPASPSSFSFYCALLSEARKRAPAWKIGSPVFYRQDMEEKNDYFSFLRALNNKEMEVDFIPVRYQYDFSDDTLLSKDRHAMKRFIEMLKNNHGFFENKMYFQGIGFTDSNSLLNDTLYASSFLIQNYMENRQDLSSYSFASLFDRSLLNAYNPNPYQGMNGLFTYNFVKKSSYNAYVFLSRMGNEIQKQSDTYLLSASSSKIVLLLNNYNHYSDLFADREYFEISNLNRYNCFPKSTNVTYKMSLSGFNGSAYRMKISTLGKNSGSSYDRWLEMGAVKTLSEEEATTLRELSEIHYSLSEDYLTSDKFDFEVTVSPLEAKIVEIEFKAD